MQSTHIPERLAALRSLMAEHQLDAFVVSKEVNLHYFSGFRGDDTMLVITPQKAFLVTDSRYTEQARQQAPLYELVEQTAGLLLRTSEVLIAHLTSARCARSRTQRRLPVSARRVRLPMRRSTT